MKNAFLPLAGLLSSLLTVSTVAPVGAVALRPQATIDLASVALPAPAVSPACYGSTEAVSVRVQNVGTNPLNFAANPMTVTVQVTGAVIQTLNRTLSTGTLAPGAQQTVVLPGTLNMTAPGSYNFGVTATVAGDQDPTNNQLAPPPTRTVAAPAVGTASAASPVVCGAGSPQLSVASFAGGPLVWESSPTGAVGSFTPIGGSTNQNPFTAPLITSTTFYRAKVQCGSQPTSNVVPVNVPTTTTWTGTLNEQWGDPANWNPCVPTAQLNVVIPPGIATYPVISAPAAANNLTINAGASLVIQIDTLEVRGNFVNNGIFQHLDGMVVMKGLNPQQLGGSSVTTFMNLTIGPSDVTLTGPVQMRRVLGLAGAGNLVLAGRPLTLLSDTVSTAMVVNLNTGLVVGNTARVQRALDPGATGLTGYGYRHFSAPISDATFTSFNLQGFTPLVNPAYNTAPNPIAVRPYPNIFGFDESRFPADTDFVKGYFSPTALTDPMEVGRGYSLYMPASVGIEFVGTLNYTDVPVTLTQTGNFLGPKQKSGWHLLGNPFPGPIGWDQMTFPAGMSQAVSVFKTTGQNTGLYRTRANGVGPLHGGDDKIPSCQGFFVRAFTTILARPSGTNSGGYTISSTSRSTTYTSPPKYRPQLDQRPMVGLSLRTPATSSANADQTWIYFEQGATAAIDEQYDGEKPMHNPNLPTIVSLTAAADELAVNGLPVAALQLGTTVPLLVDLPAAGTYVFEAISLRNLIGTPVVLVDHLTGTRYDLSTHPTVTFTARGAGELRTRFALEFNQRATGLPAEVAATALALFPNPAHDMVQVRATQPTGTVQLLDAIGRVVLTKTLMDGMALVPLAELRPGLYAVRVGRLTHHLVVN